VLWLAVLLGFLFGFAVGHFVAVPVGGLAWGGWLYYDDRRHPQRPELEGDLGTFVVIVYVGTVTAAILFGVVLRWGLRYVMQRRLG
jgi:hypothetical protein